MGNRWEKSFALCSVLKNIQFLQFSSLTLIFILQEASDMNAVVADPV